MNTDDPLKRAIGEWQRKHHIADGDPMIAALDLVRVYLEHSHERPQRDDAPIPSFEDFRGAIELLDRRSKSFINQASDLVAELRRFGQSVERLNQVRLVTIVLMVICAVVTGVIVGRWL